MAVTSEAHQVCAELRRELARRGVELPALMSLAELEISPAQVPGEPGVPVVWLGCCRLPTARRLLELLRRVPPHRDLATAVREANAQSARARLINGGG